jgi:hypothetical protein
MMEAKIAEEGQKGLDLDFSSFELEIEKEIDSLFVPLENEAVAQAKAAESSVETEKQQTSAAAIPVSGINDPVQPPPVSTELEEITIGFDTQESKAKGEAGAGLPAFSTSLQPEDFTLVIESPVEESSELKGLVEAFQASYLSLDWDFSSPNVKALSDVLAKLEPHCARAAETDSIYKILKAVIQRVSSRPDSFSPQIIEVMRDAQELLKRFLLPDHAGVTAADRARLKDLVERVHAIKNAQMRKEVRPSASAAFEPSIPLPDFGPSESLPLSNGFIPFEGEPENLADWIGRAQNQLAGTLYGLQDVNRRLYQLEEILVSKPALAPLTARIRSVRSNLEQQISAVRNQETFWSRLISVVNSRGIRLEGEGTGQPASTGQAVKRESAPGDHAASNAPKTQREQVCVFMLGGQKCAVLSANVVKIQSLNAKKMNSIEKRGYGLLKDFKPFLKSIKAGLFGSWIGLPAEILKTYQFLPIAHQTLGIEKPLPLAVQGAVLVSNGQRHGIIWSESGSIDLITETIELSSDSQTVLGNIQKGPEEEIKVLHVDQLLNMSH